MRTDSTRFFLQGLVLVLGILRSAQGQTFEVLHTFEESDGANPQAALVQDHAGNIYSTAEYGGLRGVGDVFRLEPSGNYNVLSQFQDYPDGARPVAPLAADKSGDAYGTTYAGGINCLTYHDVVFYCGTVFKVDAAGSETVLYRFAGSPDGANPNAGLIPDGKGNWYGTTVFGGTAGCDYPYGCGAVFQLDKVGTESVLYSFAAGSDGANPYGAVVLDASGDLFGTTSDGGGSKDCSSGCGTIFRLHHTASGWTESTIHQFKLTDGAVPYAGLILDSNTGEVYGTTTIGGNSSGCLYLGQPTGCGVVFKLNLRSGDYAVLYKFSGGSDGSEPYAGLIRDPKGNLYGTTLYGGDLTCNGTIGCGTVFRLDTANKLTVLHEFTGAADGANPVGALLLDLRTPALYGTATIGGDVNCNTQEGGGPGCGTVFKITP